MTFALVGAALAVLAFIFVDDLINRRIANVAVGLLAALYLGFAAAAGTVASIPIHAALAVAVVAILLIPFQRGWLGGGDVKFLAAAFLWTGLGCAFAFSLFLALATLAHAGLALAGLAGLRDAEGRRRIAFGPAASLALAATLVLCIAPRAA